ncbi:MAG TPA: amino acid adenylation domain-containing protein [Actinospica sp.]|jgi:amino acid adenylation domain-containing protein|nr:amino acid adenylation domain-containing protein [Actinospica sp.]
MTVDTEVEEYEFPVSAAQERLLVLERLTPGTAQYAIYAAYAVDGPFDAAIFERCVRILTERHEALRTTFRVVDGEFVQVIRGSAPSGLRVERGVPIADVDDLLTTEASRPFDLEHGPLLRVLIIEVEDGTHRILLATHHLVADGWSLNLIVRELSACYAALLADREPADLLSEPALQYADYAVWQREQTAAGAYAGQVAYWREALKDAPPVLTLPADLPRPQVRSAAGAHHLFEIPDTTTAALDRLAREVGVTPTMAWFAASAVFLGRLAGQSEVVVGTPVAGRDRADLQDVVGMFVNTLALRVDLGEGQASVSFRDLLSRTRDAFLGAQDNQDVPFDLVVEALAPERGLDQDPVYQVVCSLEDADGLPLALDGADVRRLELFLDVAKFDFMAQAERATATATGLRVRFVYRTELYSPSTIERWAGLLRTLLAELVADDGRRSLASVSWLTVEDRDRLIKLATGPWQPTDDASLTVVDLFQRQVRALPEAVAVVTRDESVTYWELDERSSRVAGHLAARGVGPGSVVGLSLPRSTAAMPVAVLGVLKTGAAYLPLDPDHPADRLSLLAEDAGADLLLDAHAMKDAEAAQPPSGEDVRRAAGPRDLAYIVYTSGSTGRPKGVAIEHRSLADYVSTRRAAFDVSDTDRVASLGAFTFDLSISDMFLALTAGAELHIFGADERLGAPLADRLRAARISWVMMLPSMLASLDPRDFPDLRTLFVGAEPLPAALIESWAPGRSFRNAFGPTEATVAATAAELSAGDAPVIGRPLPNARVYVLDDRLQPAPLGVVGEIYIAGPGLARGYVGRAALTAERFVADPLGPPGARMYRSGDLGRYLPDGDVLEILGRADDQLKIRGYRIEPGEIEGVLAGHDAVRRAVVIAHDDGGDDRRLVAYIVPERTEAPAADTELRTWLAERLPAHLVPAVFVTLDTLPTTASGKVNKAALPAPSNARPELARGYTAPRTELERRIAAVWAQVLRLDRVGVHDSFFDLGGTSVRLLAVHNLLTEKGDLAALDLVALFRHPTVAALAEHLSGPAPTRQQAGAERGADRRRRLDNLRRTPNKNDRKANQ